MLLGGIGASGGSLYEDTHVTRAALLAGGFGPEEADAAIAEKEDTYLNKNDFFLDKTKSVGVI